MRPLTVIVEVTQPRQVVYDFLDVQANHECFTDHVMRNWRFEGPERGVESKVCVEAVFGGRVDLVEIEVVEADPPRRIVERNVGAGGRRVATGTYTLIGLGDGGTQITFEYAWQQIPLSERLASPIVRGIMRRAFVHSMQRLAEQLDSRFPSASTEGGARSPFTRV